MTFDKRLYISELKSDSALLHYCLFKCKFNQWVGFFYFIYVLAFHKKGKMKILYEGAIFYEKRNLISMTTI